MKLVKLLEKLLEKSQLLILDPEMFAFAEGSDLARENFVVKAAEDIEPEKADVESLVKS